MDQLPWPPDRPPQVEMSGLFHFFREGNILPWCEPGPWFDPHPPDDRGITP